jgi:hypothetical protein
VLVEAISDRLGGGRFDPDQLGKNRYDFTNGMAAAPLTEALARQNWDHA